MVQNDAIHASNTTASATRKNRNRIEINACIAKLVVMPVMEQLLVELA